MRLLALVVGALACAQTSSALGLLAIDYGTEWIKASLVKPGVPFDVLLNTYVLKALLCGACYSGKVCRLTSVP